MNAAPERKKKKQALTASTRPVAESPSPATSPSAFSPPDPTAPFPGGGSWYEARAGSRARANRHCSDPAVGLVHGSDGSSSAMQELVALGSLAALRAVAKPPPQAGGDKTASIEDFVSEPLTLVSVDTPRLCLTAPNVAASSPERNREEGVDVAVSACNVPGAATPSGATVFSVENAPKSSSSDGGGAAAAAAPSPAAVSSSSAAALSSSPALRFRSLPRRSIENAPVTTAGAHSGVAAGPVVDLRPASAKAAAAAAAKNGDSGSGDEQVKEEASRCLVASGGRARLSRCPAPSSPSFAASTWRVAPANRTVASLVVDDDFGDAASNPPRKPQGAPRYAWTTTTGFLLVNQASGDCASASGEIAACDPRADGMLFSLCSGPGKCAQFLRPEC